MLRHLHSIKPTDGGQVHFDVVPYPKIVINGHIHP